MLWLDGRNRRQRYTDARLGGELKGEIVVGEKRTIIMIYPSAQSEGFPPIKSGTKNAEGSGKKKQKGREYPTK